jgi:tetratricopeptide (TPR) repeat protein
VVGLFEEAVEVFSKLTDPYEKLYYTAIAWERSAKAHLERGEASSAVVQLEQALQLYGRAEEVSPEGSPDCVLRWNRCVRLLESERKSSSLAPAREDDVLLGD